MRNSLKPQKYSVSGWERTANAWIDDHGDVFATMDDHGAWTRVSDGKTICGATRRRKGLPCQANPRLQSNRCGNHGGTMPKGVAHPAYRHGSYSTYMPTRMVEGYEDAMNDPDLLALRNDIALARARLLDLLKRVDTGEAGKTWNEALDYYDAMRQALRDGRDTEAREQMALLGKRLRDGQTDYRAWNEVQRTLELIRRLSESEQKRLVFMQQNITIEQMMLNVKRLGDILRDRIKDPKLLSLISNDLAALMRRGRPSTGGE